MKVTKKQINAQLLEIAIEVVAADYAEIERKRTVEVRKNADFKGFRKGMVPASLIRKMYGEQILGEAVNQVVGEALENYLKENKMHVLGEPLASEKQPEVEWKDGNDFCFKFDVALSPEIKLEPSKSDEVAKYVISASAKEKTDMVANMKKFYAEKKDEKETKTDEEIEKEVDERLKSSLESESDYRLNQDIRKFYVDKAAMELPSDFLKRWLFEANKGKFTMDDINKEYDAFEADLKWQLVRGYLMDKYGFKIEQKDIEEAAEAYVSYQYAMYGLGNVPQDLIKEAAVNMLKEQSQVNRLVENVEDQKVMSKLRETITIKDKKITSAKFRELK